MLKYPLGNKHERSTSSRLEAPLTRLKVRTSQVSGNGPSTGRTAISTLHFWMGLATSTMRYEVCTYPHYRIGCDYTCRVLNDRRGQLCLSRQETRKLIKKGGGNLSKQRSGKMKMRPRTKGAEMDPPTVHSCLGSRPWRLKFLN